MSLKKSKGLERNIKKSNQKIIEISLIVKGVLKQKKLKILLKNLLIKLLKYLNIKRKTYVSVFLTNNEEIKN